MDVLRHEDPVAFRTAVESLLLTDAHRHNLMLGLLDTLIDRPHVYETYLLWMMEADGEVVGAALRTPPHNVILARPVADGVIEAFVASLVADAAEVPGVVAARPEADLFAVRYAEASGRAIASRMDQAIHVLEGVEDVSVPPGRARRARPDDADLILAWQRAFLVEANANEHFDAKRARSLLARRLAEDEGRTLWLWEDGEPVSMVGCRAETRGSRRVGPVYTPPEHRCRGYATRLVQEFSADLLAGGSDTCVLYTDLANPTSNAIYRRIGYRVVCESAMISFGS